MATTTPRKFFVRAKSFRRCENFWKNRSGRCDRFRQKIVEIGTILTIFRPFEFSWMETTHFPVWEPHIVLVGNHTVSSLGTTHCPVWELQIVLFGNHKFFCWTTTNGWRKLSGALALIIKQNRRRQIAKERTCAWCCWNASHRQVVWGTLLASDNYGHSAVSGRNSRVCKTLQKECFNNL